MTKLCPRGKAAAKRKFAVYPSAYANAYASKICAGKIKDPSGTKRKDFKGPKRAMGGSVSQQRKAVSAKRMQKGGKIVAAGCVLPLSGSGSLRQGLGTRHRAAVGVTEDTDAICVVVSEENGAVSLAEKGDLTEGLDLESLRGALWEAGAASSEVD